MDAKQCTASSCVLCTRTCVQWWRAAPRCQIRGVQDDSAMLQLDCQSLESSPLLSSSSLLLLLSLALLLLAHITHTTENATDTVITALVTAITAITPEWEVMTATAITTDLQHETSCSSHCTLQQCQTSLCRSLTNTHTVNCYEVYSRSVFRIRERYKYNARLSV